MNIFYIEKSPGLAARSMVDKHVVKMILESAQLLSTAHRILDGIQGNTITELGRNKKIWSLPDERELVMYQATHVNHPSAIWTRETSGNYNWLWYHLKELCKEYTHRYGRVHKVEDSGLLKALFKFPNNITKEPQTTMPSAMADEYKISDDPLTNYRNYYRIGKSSMHKWTNRQQPEWINVE